VNDIVEVVEVVEPNFHRRPGPARVVVAHGDGTYDLRFIMETNRIDTKVESTLPDPASRKKC